MSELRERAEALANAFLQSLEDENDGMHDDMSLELEYFYGVSIDFDNSPESAEMLARFVELILGKIT